MTITTDRNAQDARNERDALRLREADAQFLTVFLSLKGEARAARWRGLDHGSKFRLIVRQIEAQRLDWMPSVVEAFIAKYDDKYAAGPIDAAIEGALERLAFDNAQQAECADKADRAFFRRSATSFVNALIEYRKGVRPDRLSSRAYLLPSRRPGEAPHLVTLDGNEWMCSCRAGKAAHWPIAMIVGMEVANDDMTTFDDGEDGPIVHFALYDDGPTPADMDAWAEHEAETRLWSRIAVVRRSLISAVA
jgi:hypothetical protein